MRRILITAGLRGALGAVTGVGAGLLALCMLGAPHAAAAVAPVDPDGGSTSPTGGAPYAEPAPGEDQGGGVRDGDRTPPGFSGESGGAGYHRRLREKGQSERRRRSRPVLTIFQVSRTSLFALGQPATISYRIRDRSRYVRVRLAFVRADERMPPHRVELGPKRTGVTHVFRWRGTDEQRFAPEGVYRIRLEARDPLGNRLVRSSDAFSEAPIKFSTHRFPVLGPYSLGGPDARFGAGRKGHTHQGQDIVAPEGTPVVAPRAGIVTWRAYQAEGAGYYLVLAGEGEPYQYVFMHLQRGSILVDEGDRVLTGQTLARVGSTGESTGPHLHFEIWHGPWFNGGRPIDPLPKLLSWKTTG